MTFDEFFEKATQIKEGPYPFQREFAEAKNLYQLVDVPTGLGKTAMAVLGWLWRRFHADDTIRKAAPRRLVYCLPMRVLVEQTVENAKKWVKNLREAGCLQKDVPIHVLMGGEEQTDWAMWPEREAILIGTQDMLLSRALNRGYAASRARWPMEFGLLNNDCLWVYDEIQLMGTGLATTAQVEAFRRLLPCKDAKIAKDSHRCQSVWMSATMQRNWLKTIDFEPFLNDARELTFDFRKEIQAEGLDETTRRTLEDRWNARKPLVKAKATMGDSEHLACGILDAHRKACYAAQKGTRTIVVVNTVKRACELFNAMNPPNTGGPQKGRKAKKTQEPDGDATAPSGSRPRIVLLHSRFRPGDRAKAVQDALAYPPPEGTIVVSTQVIEAGVDVSATTLFTELAPWASLVQRFGRCNRRGEENEHAAVRWIDLPATATESEKMAPPYEISGLKAARCQLEKLEDVGLTTLDTLDIALRFEHTHVIRRKDLIDLFDTTPDLAGNDIDIDRFVREVEDSDVRVFWRWWDQKQSKTPLNDEPAPRREELCPAPIGSDKNPGFRQFARKLAGKAWRWNFLDKKWEKAEADKVSPGQVYLVHADAGGYTSKCGWVVSTQETVRAPQIDDWLLSESASLSDQWTTFEQAIRKRSVDLDDYDDDGLSRTDCFRGIADHTDDVSGAIKSILDADAMPIQADERLVLEHAVRWHDRGKAHHIFQNAVDDGQVVEEIRGTVTRQPRPDEWKGCREIAKAPGQRKDAEGQVVDPGFWRRYDWLPKEGRKHFRHELASALAVLLEPDGHIPVDYRDRVAYLVAAHHGKVRLSIRSLPNETKPRANGNPQPQKRFACGVWDGDELPEIDLGGGVIAPAVTLSLEPMELGLCEQPPFAGLPSWAERMIRLREALGPFRLAYLEAILRAADIRASQAAEQHAEAKPVGGKEVEHV